MFYDAGTPRFVRISFQTASGSALWRDLHCDISSAQPLSHVPLFVTPRTAARQASLSITNSRGSLKLTSIQPSHPLLSPSPLALNLSQHQGLFQ